jgi:UV DNA damage endonuclease
MTTLGKIGFACKWIDNATQVDGIGPKDDARKYSTGTTTIAWLSRQSVDVAEEKLYNIVKQNLQNTLNLVIKVSTLPERLRMVRLSSEILPVYTHADWSYFYKRADIVKLTEYCFAKIGEVARTSGVRLSFHPGQFTVLASENPGIVNNSIDEFEYHADMARMMGYGKTFQDFKINVHISGKLGPAGIRAAYKRLSPEARNCITIENEENAWGLDDSLELADLLPIVLDVHHHWCREGEWIDPNSDRVKRVIDSWRGVRPVMHYSQSREDYLVGHATYAQPDMLALKDMGYKKAKLRAHSDFYWNTATNDWVLGFLPTHDIMCESKAKNLASFALYETSKQIIA